MRTHFAAPHFYSPCYDSPHHGPAEVEEDNNYWGEWTRQRRIREERQLREDEEMLIAVCAAFIEMVEP